MEVNVSAQVEHLLRLAAERRLDVESFIQLGSQSLGSLRAFLETDCIIIRWARNMNNIKQIEAEYPQPHIKLYCKVM